MVASSDEGILLMDISRVRSALGVNNSTNSRGQMQILWVPWVALDRTPITRLRPTRLQRFGAKLGLTKRTKNSVLFCRYLSDVLHKQAGAIKRHKCRPYFPPLFVIKKMSKCSTHLTVLSVNRRVCRKTN